MTVSGFLLWLLASAAGILIGYGMALAAASHSRLPPPLRHSLR
jgi:hypothetical protein